MTSDCDKRTGQARGCSVRSQQIIGYYCHSAESGKLDALAPNLRHRGSVVACPDSRVWGIAGQRNDED